MKSVFGLNCILLLVSIVISAHANAQCGDNSMDVYIIAGQSNAVGTGDVNEVPSDQQNLLSTNPNKLIWNYKNNTIEELKVGQNNSLYQGYTNTLGVEASFSEAMLAKDNKKILIFKFAKGGTSLHIDWNSRAAGTLYHEMIDANQRMKTSLTAQGLTPCYRAFFWLQGESDKGAYAKYYKNHLLDLISDLRRDLSTSSLPVFISRIGMEIDTEKFDEEQDDIAEADPKTRIVETRDLLKKADHIHFTTASLIVLGKRLLDAYENYSGNLADQIGATLKVWPVPYVLKEGYPLSIEYKTQTYCSNTSLVLYDLEGRLVHEFWHDEYLEASGSPTMKQVNASEISNLSDGLYLLTLRLDHCSVKNGKASRLITQKILVFK